MLVSGVVQGDACRCKSSEADIQSMAASRRADSFIAISPAISDLQQSASHALRAAVEPPAIKISKAGSYAESKQNSNVQQIISFQFFLSHTASFLIAPCRNTGLKA